MYYPSGWDAYVDGKPEPHFKVDYALRGLKVPAGTHEIEFKFEPQVIENGSKIALAANILLGLIVVGGAGYSLFGRKSEDS